MKRLMMTTALVAAAATGAYAQAQTQENSAVAEETGHFLAERGPHDIHASEFIGMRVYTSEQPSETLSAVGIQDNWEDIGEINDVLLTRDGEVEAVLVDIGGFLGIGERQIAVNMDAVEFVADDATAEDESDFFLVLNSNRVELEEAPEYDWSRQAMIDAPAAGEEMPTEEADVTTQAQADAEMTTEAPVEEEMTAADEPVNEDGDVLPEVAEAPSIDVDTDATVEGMVAVDATQMASEELSGAPVYDLTKEHIGEIAELIIGENNTVSGAVIDVGGFLGIGEKPVALELSQLNVMRNNDNSEIQVHVNMTMEQLKAMEEYKG